MIQRFHSAVARKRVTAPGGVLSPVAGMSLWLNADALGLSDNDPVDTWYDDSGNHFDVSQVTSGNRPLLKTGIINGNAVVRFDGVDDSLSYSGFGNSSGLSGDPSFSFFIVYAKSSASYGNVAGWGSSGSSLGAFGIYDDNSVPQYAFAGGNPYPIGLTSSGTFMLRSWVKPAGAISGGSAFLNGVPESSGGASGRTPAIVGTSSFVVGQWADYGTKFFGDVAEILVYPSALSGSDREAVEAYLMAKYAL